LAGFAPQTRPKLAIFLGFHLLESKNVKGGAMSPTTQRKPAPHARFVGAQAHSPCAAAQAAHARIGAQAPIARFQDWALI
jgi:hypothetical protein